MGKTKKNLKKTYGNKSDRKKNRNQKDLARKRKHKNKKTCKDGKAMAVLNYCEGGEIDQEDEDCIFTVVAKGKGAEVKRNVAKSGGKIKTRGKRNTFKMIAGESESENEFKRSSTLGESSRGIQGGPPTNTTSSESENESESSSTLGESSRGIQGGNPTNATSSESVHLILRSVAKQTTARASFKATMKVSLAKSEIGRELGENGEFSLFHQNGQPIDEEKSFAQNGVGTDDVIKVGTEMKSYAGVSVGQAGAARARK